MLATAILGSGRFLTRVEAYGLLVGHEAVDEESHWQWCLGTLSSFS